MKIIIAIAEVERGGPRGNALLAALQDHKKVAYPYTKDDGTIGYKAIPITLVYRSE